MLPLKSVLTSKRDRQMSKNDIEFRLYRKFGTESQHQVRDAGRAARRSDKETPKRLKSSEQFVAGSSVRGE